MYIFSKNVDVLNIFIYNMNILDAVNQTVLKKTCIFNMHL